MSGTIFDELKKNDHNKKKEKMKFFTALLMTNLLVALASWSFFSESAEPAVKKDSRTKRLHPQHKMVIAPLTVIAETDPGQSEVPVTLMNRNNKILIRRAWLHGPVGGSKVEGMGETRFKIEIPEEEIIKLSENLDEAMIAIPEVKQGRPQRAAVKRVSKYEVHF